MTRIFLPPPLTECQVHALRYRGSQKSILASHICSLDQWLRFHVRDSRPPRFVSLETILRDSPAEVLPVFRDAVHHVTRTRQAVKIKKMELEELVWTLWICTMWTHFQSTSGARSHISQASSEHEPSALHVGLIAWIQSVAPIPCPPAEGTNDRKPSADIRVSQTERMQAQHAGDSRTSDAFEVVDTYMPALRAIAQRFPESIFCSSQWTTEFLVWGLKTWQRSRFILPGGKTEGEWWDCSTGIRDPAQTEDDEEGVLLDAPFNDEAR